MLTLPEQVDNYISRYRAGDENAFFGLIELDDSVLLELIERYRNEPDSGLREFLVRVTWQHRNPSVIPFLAEALRDEEATVWKEAMDGFVALASPAAIEVLEAGRNRQFSDPNEAEGFRRWIDEAIDQARARFDQTEI